MSEAGPMEPSARASDAEARRLAQSEFAAPVVLEAGAGTGKTAVLVARVVAWSLGPGWERAETRLRQSAPANPPTAEQVAERVLRGVVAITFTEAAAAEMATRVGAALLELREGAHPPGLAEDLLPPPLIRGPRAEALVGALDQLGVRTIHAFCRRLLAGFALDAGLHPRFEVDADGQGQAEVAREVLEAILPEAFGEPFDPDFALLADRGLGPRDIESALLSLLGEGAVAADLADDPLAGSALPELLALSQAACRAFLELEAGRLRQGSKAAVEMQAVASIEATLACLEQGGAAGAAGFEPIQAELVPLWPKNLVSKLRDLARGAFSKGGRTGIGEDEGALAERAERVRRVVLHLLNLDLPLLQSARRVLHRLVRDARRLLQARGVETFGGLLRGARDLLATRPDLVVELQDTIDQILVDEFQDTDALQCELIEILALSGERSGRPGLFLVGDPKQSIYGWRGADLRAYEGFVDRARTEGGRVLSLVVNFRSVPEILLEVERIVAPIMHPEAGLQPPFEPLLPREGAGPVELPAGCEPVEHWVSWQLDELGRPAPGRPLREATELEARAVAADLQRLRGEGVALGSVALLLRSSGDFDVYLGALREAGIPFVVEREEQHGRRREVIDALAWVRCILDPNDALALVATLRSSFVGVPDAAFVPLWRRQLPARASRLTGPDSPELRALAADVRQVGAELRAPEVESQVPGLSRVEGWEENLVGFLGRLGPWRQLAEEGPVDDFIEALRSAIGLEASESARHLGAHRLASLDRVFRDLASALESTGGSAAAVLSFLRRAGGPEREHREGRPRAFGDAAVHVLTVHKAKGLGFDHVYLLQTHKGSGRNDARRTALVRGPDRQELILFGAASPGMLTADEDRDALEDRERIRLLYVAATRAKQRLVVSGRRPEKTISRPRTHVDLLTARLDHPTDLAGWMLAAKAAGASSQRDEAGVPWRFSALESLPARRPASELAGDAPEPAGVVVQERRLAVLRREAEVRMARPFHGTASGTHSGPPPFVHEPEGETEDDWLDRDDAMALGTAFHRALEELPLDAPLSTWQATVREVLEASEVGSRAATQATALRDRFFASELPARLRGLAGRVIGREVPLLLVPEVGEDEPVGFVAGAIDLLYRSAEDERVVVVDYKTDRVAGARALGERASGYAEQGRIYTRAVQQALGLPYSPRFELWFLHAGEVVSLP